MKTLQHQVSRALWPRIAFASSRGFVLGRAAREHALGRDCKVTKFYPANTPCFKPGGSARLGTHLNFEALKHALRRFYALFGQF